MSSYIIYVRLLAMMMARMTLLNPIEAASMDIDEKAAMLGVGNVREARFKAGGAGTYADAWEPLDSALLRRLFVKYDIEYGDGKTITIQNRNGIAKHAERQKRTPTESEKCDDKDNKESMNVRELIAKNRHLKTSTTRPTRKTCYPIGRFIRPCYNN